MCTAWAPSVCTGVHSCVHGSIRAARKAGWRLPCAHHGPHSACTGVTAVCLGQSVSPGRLVGVSHVHSMGPTVRALGSQLCIGASPCPQEGWLASPRCPAWAPQRVHWGHSCVHVPVCVPGKLFGVSPCANHVPVMGALGSQLCIWASPCPQGGWLASPMCTAWAPHCVHWGHSCV